MSSSISQHLLPQHKLPLSRLIHINPFQDECSSSAPCWSWYNYTIAIARDDSLCTNHRFYFCGFVGGQHGRGEDAELLSLKSIFHCPFIKESANSQNGKVSWLCKWCGKKFTPRHQSRVLKDVLKITYGDIAICTSAIPKNSEDQ